MFDKIKHIEATEILDSRGYPTVYCKVVCDNGVIGEAMVPSGASTGEREALELRDGDPKRYMGKGVLKAVKNVNEIIGPHLISKNLDVCDQTKIDNEMIDLDKKLKTNKSSSAIKGTLGANAILAVSLACAKAGANHKKKPLYAYIREDIKKDRGAEYILPVPMLNVINGGAHADNTIDFQEFMFMPIGAKSLTKACQIASECFHTLAKILKSNHLNTSKGDEGGFAPMLKSPEEALNYMVQAIKEAGYKPGKTEGCDVGIALDVAASELWDEAKKAYVFKKAIDANIISEAEGTKTTTQMIDYLLKLVEQYPIVSIEDGLAQNDMDGWKEFVARADNKFQIVGDDLFCTDPNAVDVGVKQKTANAVLVKPNQIGTLTETIATITTAHLAGWSAVVSHRSGETEDTFIADLAVALGTGQIKTGSMSRSERICKYNRLMLIEKELGPVSARYNGLKSLSQSKQWK